MLKKIKKKKEGKGPLSPLPFQFLFFNKNIYTYIP